MVLRRCRRIDASAPASFRNAGAYNNRLFIDCLQPCLGRFLVDAWRIILMYLFIFPLGLLPVEYMRLLLLVMKPGILLNAFRELPRNTQMFVVGAVD
jgi:hypothetical protein